MIKKTLILKTIILATIAILPCFLNTTSALALNDCDVIIKNISNFKTTVFGGKMLFFSKVYSGDALERAIYNLTAYCCQKDLNQLKKKDPRCSDQNITNNFISNYPESPYLFDHLIDVGLRRLDALNSYNGVTVDPTGEKRRDFIQGMALNPDVTSAMKIKETYGKYRTLSGGWMFRKIHLKIESMGDDEKSQVDNFLNQYDNETIVSLADKYNNLCRITRNIYEKKPGPKMNIGGDGGYYTACQKMVSRRMNQESLYTETILMDKANKMLQDNLEKSLIQQFAQDKLVGLQKVITMIKDLLQTVTKQAPYCKKCSK